MDTLWRLYTIVVDNICKAREKRPKKTEEQKPHSFQDKQHGASKRSQLRSVWTKIPTKLQFTAIFGDNWIEVQDEKGHKSVRWSSHVKYIEPAEKVVQQLPSKEVLQNYGRGAKLLIAAKDIPNLGFQLEKNQRTWRTLEKLARGHWRHRTGSWSVMCHLKV